MSTQKMVTHKISVTIEGRSIRVSPDPLIMKLGDEMRWAGMGAQRFSIEFEGTGPFTEGRLRHDAAIATQHPSRKGRFKYTVVLESDSTVRLDPVIIVEDPPTKP